MDRKTLDLVFGEISQRKKWPKPELWNSYYFIHLSEDIFQKSGIAVSPDTIHRLVGKKGQVEDSYKLHEYTKLALLKYLDWESFERNSYEE